VAMKGVLGGHVVFPRPEMGKWTARPNMRAAVLLTTPEVVVNLNVPTLAGTKDFFPEAGFNKRFLVDKNKKTDGPAPGHMEIGKPTSFFGRMPSLTVKTPRQMVWISAEAARIDTFQMHNRMPPIGKTGSPAVPAPIVGTTRQFNQ